MHCRRRKQDKVKQAVDEETHTFAFMVGKVDDAPVGGVKERGLMAHSRATLHIVTGIAKIQGL